MKENKTFFHRITYTDGIYPSLIINQIQNPNRLFAFPLIGILIKLILLIPIFIELVFLAIWLFIVVSLINPFVVLFTGKYLSHAHSLSVGFIRLSTKITFYIYGLTDKYPWFGLQNSGDLNFDIPINQSPKRLFAIPVLGGLIRFILLIPYLLFDNIMSYAAGIGVMILAWAVVLIRGKYPEGLFELARDSSRVSASAFAYMSGLSDKYPSFHISMAHNKIKLILIAIAVILNGWNYVGGGSRN